MATSHGGFAEQATAYQASSGGDFVQAERDRLRAGLLDQTPVTIRTDPRLAEALHISTPSDDKVTGRALGKFAELWRTRHQTILSNLPHGTCVTVDLASGLWFIGTKRWEASDLKDELLATGRAGWSFEHGVPLTLGGGLWALNSEA
jgi:hypothetical protein